MTETRYSVALTPDDKCLIIESTDGEMSWTVVGTISANLAEQLVLSLNYRPDIEHAHCDRVIHEWVIKAKNSISLASSMAAIISKHGIDTDEARECISRLSLLHDEETA